MSETKTAKPMEPAAKGYAKEPFGNEKTTILSSSNKQKKQKGISHAKQLLLGEKIPIDSCETENTELVEQVQKWNEKDWDTCIKNSSTKMADDLLNSNCLPTMNELNELCHTFGRKSETTIKVCKEISRYIESLSPLIVDVYPSRKAVILKRKGKKKKREEKFEIKFVVLTEKLSEEGRHKLETRIKERYDTHPVRDCYQLSSEETDLQKKHKYELKGEALNKVKECLRQNAGTLLNRHKYLTIVSGCPFKSIGYGTDNHRIEERPCIVLNVPYKGYIPIDEDPFEKFYNGVQTDVREDVFVLFGDTAKDRLDNLMAGCLISGEPDENEHCAKGTLGGFFVHPDYGPCGISCSHAVLSPSELHEMGNNEINWERPSLLLGNSAENCQGNVYQPTKKQVSKDDNAETDDYRIGRLVKVRYRRGKEKSQDLDAYGMDVAIFQLSNRFPESGTFPDVKVSASAKETRDIPVNFGKGDVEGFTLLDKQKYSKYGSTTGYTTTNLSINNTVSVKKTTKWAYEDNKKKVEFEFILHNQVSFQQGHTGANDRVPFDRPDESTDFFAYFGDSGALVYRENYDGNLLCVGMVVGGTISKKACIVTPILPVLKEIGITHFKNFDIDQMENNVKTVVNDVKSLATLVKDMNVKLDKALEFIDTQKAKEQS